jgi:catechol 2,3-dioxygenase-like lactoylglutathione lyase family enzyme
MIKGVKFVAIPVRDQDRALEFYTASLGFTLVTDQPFNDTQRWIELRIPGSDTRVVLFTMDGHADRIGTAQGVTFLSANVQRTYDELVSRGVTFDGPPQTADWGSSAIFRDQDGNQFVISSK